MSENTLKVIVLLMIVGAVVGLISGYAVAPRGEDTTALDNKITELEEQVSGLESEIADKDAETSMLGSLIAELEEMVPGMLNITDSRGVEIQIPYPLKKIVVINPPAAEVIRALNMTDRIVGVSGSMDDSDYWPELSKKTVVSEFAHNEPNYEMIFELNETVGGLDAVIHYGTHPAVRRFFDDMAATLAPIPVIGIDCYKFESLYDDIETLALMFGKSSASKEILEFLDGILVMVEERTSGIPEEDRVWIYTEHHGGEYSTGTKKSTLGKVITKAGGNNIFGNLPGSPYKTISPAELIERNPHLVLRDCRTSSVPVGYNLTDTATMQAHVDDILARAERDGWNSVDAVVNGKVYLLSEHLLAGPKKCIAVAYVAKMLYPELFADVDVEEFLREYFERFQRIPFAGVFLYPPPW